MVGNVRVQSRRGRRISISLSLWPTLEDRARCAKELQEKGSFRGWEQKLLRRSGEPFTALASAQIMNVAGEEVVLSTWLDINDRKRAEEALRESERHERERAEELATMLEALPTPVIIVHDSDGTHMTGNRAADEPVPATARHRESRCLRLPRSGPVISGRSKMGAS